MQKVPKGSSWPGEMEEAEAVGESGAPGARGAAELLPWPRWWPQEVDSLERC